MDTETMYSTLEEAFQAVKTVLDALTDENGEPVVGKRLVWRKLDNVLGTLDNIQQELEIG